MASEVRDGRSDGERSQPGGTRRAGPREGDLDVLSATTTASGRVQRSGRNKSEQKRRAQIDSCWCNIPDMFVDPASRAAYYWMALVTVAVIYNWIVIILRVAFEDMRDNDAAQKIFRVLDIVCDAIYLMDVAIQSRTAYHEDGCLVKSLPETMRHYRNKPRFVLDVLSVMPLSTMLYVFSRVFPLSLIPSFSELVSSPAMRFLRLLKYPSVTRFFEKTDSHTNNPNLLRAFKLSLYLWLVIHWTGCFYYLLSRYEGLGINDWVYPNSTEHSSFKRKYIFSMYWSTMTLTTIGERPWPATDVEYIFTGLTFLIGVFVFAAVVGNVGDVISNMNAARHDFQARMDQIKFYLNHRNVPEHLQDQIKRWAEYTWARTKAIDEHSMLQLLPSRLRTEVAIHVHLQTLKKVRIFEQCEEGLLRELVLKLKPSIFSPGEYICRIGEIGREMYIIDHGKVEILFPDRQTGQMKQVAIMKPGNYFGEISLLKLDDGQNKRTADVRSIGFSELLCLSRRDLLSALMEYPEAKKILEAQARQRMQQTKWTSSEPRPAEETASGVRASGPGRRSARSIFAEVMKQEGFSKLLSSKANQELTEMREILGELKDIKSHLSETTVKQLAKQCQSVEQQLEEKERELKETRSQLLLMTSVPSTMPSNLTLVSTCSLSTDLIARSESTFSSVIPGSESTFSSLIPCSESTFSSVSTAQQISASQSGISEPVKPRRPFNAVMVLPPYDPKVVAAHRRRRLSPCPRARQSVEEDRPQLDSYTSAGGELFQDASAALNPSLGDGGGDEPAVTKDEPEKDQGEEDMKPATIIRSESTSGCNLYSSPVHSATTHRTPSADSNSSFEIINLSSVESSSEQRTPTRGGGRSGGESPSDSSESAKSRGASASSSYSSATETSSSSSTSSSGGRGNGPKPAKPKPKYKKRESQGSDTQSAGDSLDPGNAPKKGGQNESQETETQLGTGEEKPGLNTLTSSEWSSLGSDSYYPESVVCSSATKSDSKQRGPAKPSARAQPDQQMVSQNETAVVRDKRVSPSERRSFKYSKEGSSCEQSPTFTSSPPQRRGPWDDTAMLGAAGISPKLIAYLGAESEDRSSDFSRSDEDDCRLLPATRVHSDFHKSVIKEPSPKAVTCRKIDDKQLSILLAKRREVNDSPDYIVESVRKTDPTCNVGTGRLSDVDHSHSVHSVIESPDQPNEKNPELELKSPENESCDGEHPASERIGTCNSEKTTEYEHFLVSYGRKSRYSKVEFSLTKPACSIVDSVKGELSVTECTITEHIQDKDAEDSASVSTEQADPSTTVPECQDDESLGSTERQNAAQDDGDQVGDGKDSTKTPSMGLCSSEEHEKKYPVSILKKPKSDSQADRSTQETSLDQPTPDKTSFCVEGSATAVTPEDGNEKVLQAHDANLCSEKDSSPLDICVSSKDVLGALSDPNSLMKDSESELSAVEYDSSCMTGDLKLLATKKCKRSRNRVVELQLGLFPLSLRNEAIQKPPVVVADTGLTAVADEIDTTTFQQDETQARPLQDAVHLVSEADNDDDGLLVLRRKYSASRFRRLSIDRPPEVTDSTPADSNSLPSKLSSAIEKSCTSDTDTLAMIPIGVPSPIRKHSEKLGSLIASFDSPKKTYIREDFLISSPKNTTVPSTRTETPASEEVAKVDRTCQSPSEDGLKTSPPNSPALKKKVTPKEDGRESSSSMGSTPTNSPPQTRKTLRRRSLTKRLSNPYGNKESSSPEKNKTAPSKKDCSPPRENQESKPENEAAFQEPPGEGPPFPSEKKALMAVVTPVSAGPEGENPQDTPSKKENLSSQTDVDSCSALVAEFDPLCDANPVNAKGSYGSCEEQRVDGEAPDVDGQASTETMSFKDKIQQAASRLRTCEASDKESSSNLESSESYPTNPSHPDNNLNASVLASDDSGSTVMGVSPLLMCHAADQAGKMVENLPRPDSPSALLQTTQASAGNAENLFDLYGADEADFSISSELKNSSNSMYRPESIEPDCCCSEPPSTSTSVVHMNTVHNTLNGMQSDRDHLQISVRNSAEQLQEDFVRDLLHLDDLVYPAHQRVENITTRRTRTSPISHQVQFCTDSTSSNTRTSPISHQEHFRADSTTRHSNASPINFQEHVYTDTTDRQSRTSPISHRELLCRDSTARHIRTSPLSHRELFSADSTTSRSRISPIGHQEQFRADSTAHQTHTSPFSNDELFREDSRARRTNTSPFRNDELVCADSRARRTHTSPISNDEVVRADSTARRTHKSPISNDVQFRADSTARHTHTGLTDHQELIRADSTSHHTHTSPINHQEHFSTGSTARQTRTSPTNHQELFSAGNTARDIHSSPTHYRERVQADTTARITDTSPGNHQEHFRTASATSLIRTNPANPRELIRTVSTDVEVVRSSTTLHSLADVDTEEDPRMLDRIVGSAMVEALQLNANLLDSVGAPTTNDALEAAQAVGSLILLADYGVEDDDEGALSDISNCNNHSDNSDLEDL
ncbi:uncharacterized protein [Littorina saxatilis]|uniref:uncharacterized protein n=1 Tax=Littorina saxatilis TaxID=31220 RepID=UPI0038B6777B